MRPTHLRPLRIAAAATLFFHASGLAAAFFGIRYGTAEFPTRERIAFVATSFAGWKLAWGVWLFAAAAFVWFLAMVDHVWNASNTCARLALAIGVAAAALDCVFDTLQIVVLPEVARGGDARLFEALAHFAAAGGIVVANGLYAIAVALMTAALGPRISPLCRWLGWATLGTGMLLTAAGFLDDPRLPEYFTGPAIGTYMLWVAAMALQEPRTGI